MRYSGCQVVFQEIPNEISLAFQVTGCPLRCPGCHSSSLWNTLTGCDLNIATLTTSIKKHQRFISCVLYLGGEWDTAGLIAQLDHIKSFDLKTALYTGLDYSEVDGEIIRRLDYLKYGKYVSELGPLSSIKSNQRLISLKTNENLNHYFVHGGQHD